MVLKPDQVSLDPIRYYRLNPGFLDRCCDALEKPSVYLDEKLAETTNIVAKIGLYTLLGLPALIGSGIKNLIYSTAAEKVKKEDYLAEREKWLQKEFYMWDSQIAKKFIDFCIHNKIKAESCPHETFINRRVDAGNPVYIFTGDGVAFRHDPIKK